MTLIDPNTNKPINGNKVYSNPNEEFGRVIKMVETAQRTGTAELCAQLEAVAQAGYTLGIDERIPATLAEITVVIHLKRDVDGKVKQFSQRYVRLGKSYTEALIILNEQKAQCISPK